MKKESSVQGAFFPATGLFSLGADIGFVKTFFSKRWCLGNPARG
jgi:hypothetical protein